MSKLSKGLKKIEKKISNIIPHAHSAQTRAEMAAAKEQLDYYQQQKETLKKETERADAQREQERKKLHAKQIRTLRRNYSSGGFMEGPNTGESDQLG